MLPDEEVTVEPPPVQVVTPVVPPKQKVREHTRKLVTHMSKSKIENRTTLVLSFTLTAKARVQLVARRRGKVVAKSANQLLKAGRHTVKLKLDVHHWPTALALHAVVPGSHGSSGGSSGGGSGPSQTGNGAGPGQGTIST